MPMNFSIWGHKKILHTTLVWGLDDAPPKVKNKKKLCVLNHLNRNCSIVI